MATTYTNIFRNSRPGATNTGYASVQGTGGTSTTAVITNAAGPMGANAARAAWTVGNSNTTGSGEYIGSASGGGTTIAATAGTVYTFSCYVRCNKAQSIIPTINWQTTAGGAISGTAGPAISLAANTWTLVPNLTGTAPATTGIVRVSLFSGGTGSVVFNAGDSLDIQGATFVAGSALPQPFHGSLTDTATETFAWTGTVDASNSTMVVQDVATPTLTSRWVGIGDSTSVPLTVETAVADSVRIKAGTNSALTTGVVFSSAQTPDGEGFSDHTVTGLSSGRYFFRVAMSVSGVETLDTASTVGEFVVAPTGQSSFAFCFGACCNNAVGDTTLAAAAIAARRDPLFFMLGDFYYDDTSGTTVANFRTHFDSRVATGGWSDLLATTPTGYIPSDHDGMINNSTAGTDATAWTNWNQVYRERVPAPGIPATTGVYRTYTWGRIRFIHLDTRSFKSAPSATDNSSKVALGATQRQWLLDTINNDSASKVFVLVNADPWIGAAVVGDDSWLGFTTDRTGVGNDLAGTGKNIVMLSGDMHADAADDGTHNTGTTGTGGFALFHGAPMNNNASQKGGPYTVGPSPASPSTTVSQQYGRIVVTDSGTSIALAYTGYNSSNTSLLTLTKTFTGTGVTTFSGATSLAATTTLSVSGVRTTSGAVFLESSCTLDLGVGQTVIGTISLPATGTLTSNGIRTTSGAAALLTTTSLTVNALVPTGSVSLTTTSTLSLGVLQTAFATVSLGVAASLSTSGIRTTSGTAALTAVTTLTSGAFLTTTAVASLPATTTLSVVALGPTGNSVLVAASTLAVNGIRTTAGVVSLTVSSGLTTAALLNEFAAVSLPATAALLSAGLRTTSGTVALSAAGVLVITLGGIGGSVTLATAQSLSTNALLNVFANTSLNATTTLVVSGVRIAVSSVTLSATSTLTSTASAATVSVTLSAIPVLTAAVSVRITQGSATLAVLGTLSVNGIRIADASVVPLVASGSLSVNGTTGSGGGTSLGILGILSTGAVRIVFGVTQLNALPVISLNDSSTQFAVLILGVNGALSISGVVVEIGTVTLLIGTQISISQQVNVGAVAFLMATALLNYINIFPSIVFGRPGSWSSGGIHSGRQSWAKDGIHVGSTQS